MFTTAMDHNLDQMGALAANEATNAKRGPITVLDLGCWDGANANRYLPANAVRCGIEQNPESAGRAAQAGYRVTRADLNQSFPLAADTFDLVTSNQVFEHLHDTDNFVAESLRVLRPGGLLVLSTENLASWHNIGSLVLGWQAFSLTNVTDHVAGIGNPLANLRGDEGFGAGWQHQRIFSHRGLKELLRQHGFAEVRVYGSGYYPLPSRLARIDARHAALIIAAGRKPAA
jgi:SAM-dependent methyltransferase